jgi:hypothetical protein
MFAKTMSLLAAVLATFGARRRTGGGVFDGIGRLLQWADPTTFDSNCPITFRFERRLTARGIQLIEFSFDAPADSCFPAWGGNQRYYARRTGKILVEEATGELVQSDDALVGFPAGFAWTRVEQETVWDQVKIGEDGHLLQAARWFISPAVIWRRYRFGRRITGTLRLSRI